MGSHERRSPSYTPTDSGTSGRMPGSSRSLQLDEPLGGWCDGQGMLAADSEKMNSLGLSSAPTRATYCTQRPVKRPAGFLDHAGSIGEAISNALAHSKRQAQRPVPSPMGGMSRNFTITDYKNILEGLKSHAARKLLCEKAIIRWYEVVNQFNEVAQRMGDYWHWKKFMADIFTHSVNFRISENWDSSLNSFDLSFPMLCSVWESLERYGQLSLEMKPSRLRVQALSNGSIMIEDPECVYVSHWRDGSCLDRTVSLKASLDLSLMVQWVELRFIGRKPSASWFALEKLLDPSISSTLMLEKLKKLVKLAQVIGGTFQMTPTSGDSNSPNDAAMDELRSHIRAFSSLSEAGSPQRAKKALQMANVMCGLTDLLAYQRDMKIASPLDALNQYVNEHSNFRSPDLPTEGMPLANTHLATSGYGKPFTVPIKKDKRHTVKKRKVTKKSDLPYSSRPHKEKCRGNNIIPGTKKIRF